MRTTILTGIAASLAWAGAATADETTYHFGTGTKHTNVTFVSKTDLETIVGSTQTIRGTAKVDWAAHTAAVDLTVPIASLRTGIPLRDEHLRSPDWVDAAKFPDLRFVSKTGTSADGKTWTLEGTFAFHGVERPLAVTARVQKIPAELAQKAKFGEGEWIRVSCEFPLTVTDFGVVIPGGVAPKVQATWQVTVSLTATTAAPAKPGDMPESAAPSDPVDVPKVTAEGTGTRYAFGTAPQLVNLLIESKTDLETVLTRSSVLAGEAVLDATGGRVKLAVPVGSLRTGIAMRDEHLRSPMWLDAERYPTITFASTKAEKAGDRRWKVTGDFTMHGVTKALVIEVQATPIAREVIAKAGFTQGGKGGLSVRASFALKLSDFGVKVPDAAAGKVSDALAVSVDMLGIEQ